MWADSQGQASGTISVTIQSGNIYMYIFTFVCIVMMLNVLYVALNLNQSKQE